MAKVLEKEVREQKILPAEAENEAVSEEQAAAGLCDTLTETAETDAAADSILHYSETGAVDYRYPKVTIRPEDGYFIRNQDLDIVVCPAGNTLRLKCTKSNGYKRYMCKAACSHCSDFRRCYNGKHKWKEIDFPEGKTVVKCRNWNKTV